ncbi:hypothetical protein [Salegentibacter sp.]|uniref:hypothetical protein n=1 Tax=Salegentibacter sp. TaxID=1903072 RepID=UPI003563A1DC
MLKNISILLAALFSVSLFGQKETLETLDAKNVEAIRIFANEVSSISIETSSTKTISAATHSEGEYYNRIGLDIKREDETLILNSKFPQALSGGFDKLSAHKVFSIDLKLLIPAGLRVFVKSDQASLTATGDYSLFEAELNQGFCDLIDFSGNGRVQTIMGDIHFETRDTRIEAESRNGRMQKSLPQSGSNLLKLSSVNGDISLLKTK